MCDKAHHPPHPHPRGIFLLLYHSQTCRFFRHVEVNHFVFVWNLHSKCTCGLQDIKKNNSKIHFAKPLFAGFWEIPTYFMLKFTMEWAECGHVKFHFCMFYDACKVYIVLHCMKRRLDGHWRHNLNKFVEPGAQLGPIRGEVIKIGWAHRHMWHLC